MICSTKTMLKVALGIFVGTGLAYLALPEFRTWIIAASPTLLFLICPISMIFCMKMMSGQNGQGCQTSALDSKDKSSAASTGTNVKTR